MYLLDTAKTLGVGVAGLATSAVSATVVENIAIPINDWASALVQLAIAVATIFGLFRKKKN